MEDSVKLNGKKHRFTRSTNTERPGDIVKITATLYAQHLVKFVLRHHGIECDSEFPPTFWEGLRQIFEDNVGKIIVAYARGSEKETLTDTAQAMMLITTSEEFEAYCMNFRHLYFSNYGCSPESIFKYFTYVIEQSTLLYLYRGMQDAPLIAVDMIVNYVLDSRDRKFMVRVGLEELNEVAIRIWASDASLRESYESGKFAWQNAR